MASKPNVAAALRAGLCVALLALASMALATPQAGAVDPASPRQTLGLLRNGQQLDFAGDSTWLRLRPDDGALRLALALPAGSGAGTGRYRSWLVGHDRHWVPMQASGQRLFPPLRPGGYRLRSAVALQPGEWLELAPVTITVAAPWWHDQGWLAFAGLLALSTVGAWALGHRRRVRRREAWRLVQARRSLAEEHSAAKSRFLATLGHELRTPMTGVLGMAELLEASSLDPVQRSRVLAIQQAGRHLLRLVNDALDLARIEAGKLVLEETVFELRPLLQEVAGLLRPMAVAKGLGFRLDCAAAAPDALRGDATRVRQILFNLGHNAIKFSDRGNVVIEVGALAPQGLRLVVDDDGPGLPPALQARLFRRFEQGHGPDSTGSGGSGLGLSICRELAAAMGGVVAAGNRAGGGARFEVLLPLPSAPIPAAVTAAKSRAVAPLRVLLVEDDAVVAEVFIGLLRRAGHDVVHAAHGLAALAELACGRFKLALLDLDLPGLDGFALARLIRERDPPLPLMAITARADSEAEPAARAAGMAGFLRKPVDGERLLEAINALLDPPGPG